MRIVHELLEEDQDSVSGMVEERDAKEKTALKALKAFRDSAYLMEVVVDVNPMDAQREHKGAQCSAKHMVVVNGVHTRVAPKVQKEAHRSVKDMEEVKDVPFKQVILAPRVFMEVPISVWHMAVVRDVRFPNAQRVLEEGLISVLDMVEEKDVSLKDVAKVLKVVLTFAKHMEEGNGVRGVILRLSMRDIPLLVHVPRLLEVRLVFVHSITVWFRITGFMAE